MKKEKNTEHEALVEAIKLARELNVWNTILTIIIIIFVVGLTILGGIAR